MAEKVLIIGGGTGLAGWIFYYLLKKKREAEEHYDNLRGTKIWSIEELKTEVLKNNTNPAYPVTVNYEEYSRFNNVLVQGELWCDPKKRIKGKIRNYKGIEENLKNEKLKFDLDSTSNGPEYIRLDYNISKDVWYKISNSRSDVENFEYHLTSQTKHLIKKEEETKSRIYLSQPIQSGLGLRYAGLGGFNLKNIIQNGIDVFNPPSKEDNLEKIELKSLKIKDLYRFEGKNFKNVRVSRAGFEPVPTTIQLLTPIVGGLFSNNFSMDKATNFFDLTFRETEWGLKVGTPAFVFGSLVVDKGKSEVYFDQIFGVFKTKKEFMNFLKSDIESYNFMLFLFGICATIGGAFLLNYLRNTLFGLRSRRRNEQNNR